MVEYCLLVYSSAIHRLSARTGRLDNVLIEREFVQYVKLG